MTLSNTLIKLWGILRSQESPKLQINTLIQPSNRQIYRHINPCKGGDR
ncbi:hypothetical protein D1BOALGB6SA_9440 [Olavius sp. associated proteobacterium Delta 1]|nr:hypothetical protein D1BOALGB6SA_9440 [Olavius sp. associated proteobacterium Delta 1]